MYYYVYIASSSFFRALGIAKLGCTHEPYGRLSTYLTGCPPGLTHDIEFDGVWQTTATCQEDLFDFEDELHNRFLRYRMMREKPGDSEWFNFQDLNAYEEVEAFLRSRPWIARQISLSEILPPKRPHSYLRKQYAKNLHFIRKQAARNGVLNLLQAPVIAAIAGFVQDPVCRAGTVIAPCGSGKTTMTTRGLRGIQRCIIACPSKQIQDQWRATLVAAGTFEQHQIHIVGNAGTTDPQKIAGILQQPTYCLITTYMSSPLLVASLASSRAEIIIFDEAHHMAGVVGPKEGPTRWLIQKAAELSIKRLSLTYTPRFVVGSQALSMDDELTFGPVLAELKLRDLIRAGVLPDYRLWTLRDESRKGTGILGKAACLLEAWGSTEVIRGEEKHILHHLIVFAATTQEARDLEVALKEGVGPDTVVLRVEEGDRLEAPLAAFAAASRAILVNCFVLNEGVDVPCANAVAITYPKQSRGQITQMVLRAGRWYENKPVFHILLPTLGDEDLSGFEEVLAALASCDDQIRDEIVLRSTTGRPSSSSSDSTRSDDTTGDVPPECIMLEEYEADVEAIRRCFHNLRRSFYAVGGRRIQALCAEKSIGTSIEYALLRQEMPELPEDPRPKATTWYDFLHPQHIDRPTPAAFVAAVLEPQNLRVAHMYDAWRSLQPTDVWSRLPMVQHITDGFFGADEANFDGLLRKYGRRGGLVRGR